MADNTPQQTPDQTAENPQVQQQPDAKPAENSQPSPDLTALQSQLAAAQTLSEQYRQAAITSRISQQAALEAITLGVDVKTIPYVLKMADFSSVKPDKDGAPEVAATFTRFCNYQDTAQRVYTSDKHYIQLTGKALFNGDIFPGLPVIADGQAEIFGEPRRIFRGTKARNPDGSVNYTQIDLI
jgi:hypothetical protein